LPFVCQIFLSEKVKEQNQGELFDPDLVLIEQKKSFLKIFSD